MDIVIPLGNGSHWDNLELKFALRSLVAYCHHVDNVYIIGEKPNWLKSVVHIPAVDKPGQENKERNICNKILLACSLPELSTNFLFMNDDHFLLSRIPPLWCYYHDMLSNTIDNRPAHDSYYYALQNTLEALDKKHLPTKNFDCHAPIIYNKEKFKRVMSRHDWTIPNGYVIKSLYCNTLSIPGKKCTDLKITTRFRCSELEALTAGRKFFSIGDGATGADLNIFLNYLYPDKSKYEL